MSAGTKLLVFVLAGMAISIYTVGHLVEVIMNSMAIALAR